MGVGYPVDLVVCSALGVDMYDCVYPTRTARFGTALADVPGGLVKVKVSAFASDPRPLDPNCSCFVCKGFSRAQLHILMKTEALGPQLLTHHNLAYMMRLTRAMRAAIIEGTYEVFVQRFLSIIYPDSKSGVGGGGGGKDEVEGGGGGNGRSIPRWVMDALESAGIKAIAPR